MLSFRFIPAIEPLEGKLLLTVLPMMPMVENSHAAMPVENVGSQIDIEGIKLSMEHQADASFLLVQLGGGEFHAPCTVCIVGGESVMTASEGTARLQLPHAAQSIDLTIHDNQGVYLASVRLEFGAGGEIVSESWSKSESTAADRTRYVVATDHSDAMHTMTLLSVPMDVVDHDHDIVARGNSRSAAVDAALAHHFMTPTNPSHESPMPATGHFSRGNHSSPPQVELDESEVAAVHSTESSPDHSTFEARAIPAEVPVEKEVDAILANWTADEQSEPASDSNVEVVAMRNSFSPIPPANVPTKETATPPMEVVYAAYFASLPNSVPVEEPSESTQWPLVGGIAVTVMAASAAVALDRKAQRKPIEEI